MSRSLKSVIMLPGFQSLLPLFMLLASFYLILRSQKKPTMKDRIMAALDLAGFNPITSSFILSQAAHETGNFTSPVFLANNNLFGMKMPAVRPTTAKRQQLGYAAYDSIEDSVQDYALYYKYFHLPTGLMTLEQFVSALYAKQYFEAKLADYIKGCQHFYNMYFGK